MIWAVLIFVVVMACVCAYLALKGELDRDLTDTLPDLGDRWIRRK